MIEIDKELDTRGLRCPLPILRTKFAMDGMVPGQVLRVVSTDGGSVKDMEAYARQTGNELIGHFVEGDEFVFLLVRRG